MIRVSMPLLVWLIPLVLSFVAGYALGKYLNLRGGRSW